MELSAKELRLGNYITVHGHIQEVCELPLPENCTNENTKPIPLTDEWLLKFAFELSLDNWYLKGGANGDSFWLFKVNYDEKYRVSMVEKTISYVKYVHQLQNLYFALTGEELQLKLE